DMTTSHAGALAGSPGVVVAAGTGAVALAVDHDGRSAVADGWGSWLGDDGSGFAIGRRGLQAVLRAHDGRGAATPLTERARQRYGDPTGLPRLVHSSDNPAREIAAFASDVLDLAVEGDAWCRQVWAQAAEALAATTAAAARSVLPPAQPALVATTGGLFGAGELLTRAYDEALERLLPGHDRRPAVGDSCDGARLLATRSGLPHAALLVVSSDATPAPPRSPQ
ncbi:N-acetylglucosamine kinase, partial [Ornithinicoccus halotolerans]|uniref:N-acetylglucosamine kinase n=1 Tax=Ornithinicoccus halotolerans TaxID=1748220 RepID=UPI001296EFD2